MPFRLATRPQRFHGYLRNTILPQKDECTGCDKRNRSFSSRRVNDLNDYVSGDSMTIIRSTDSIVLHAMYYVHCTYSTVPHVTNSA